MAILDYNVILSQIRTLSNYGTANSVFAEISYTPTLTTIQWIENKPLLPSCFVAPGGTTTSDNKMNGAAGYKAVKTERFSVGVLISSGGDIHAQSTPNEIAMFRETLRTILTNWHPIPNNRTIYPITEVGDSLWYYEGASRIGWQFDYEISYQITTTDCYIPNAITLTSLTANVVNVSNTVGQ